MAKNKQKITDKVNNIDDNLSNMKNDLEKYSKLLNTESLIGGGKKKELQKKS